MPLSNDPDVGILISSFLDRFPDSIKHRLKVILKALDRLGENTEANIYEIADISLKEIIIPVLSGL
ncbi:hypothetical protein DRN86_03365 [Candidatus Geothermarchaeota archaeon]|nr:MAG: hypothetical protein DRN86_03365 [Candidatus Geothermarchaeota archaeon]